MFYYHKSSFFNPRLKNMDEKKRHERVRFHDFGNQSTPNSFAGVIISSSLISAYVPQLLSCNPHSMNTNLGLWFYPNSEEVWISYQPFEINVAQEIEQVAYSS